MPVPVPAERARRWTAREVRQLIADAPNFWPRYELVDGELLVTPGPSKPHQEAVALLFIALREYLEREPVGHGLMSPSDVELEAEDVRQPDVYVTSVQEWQRVRHGSLPEQQLTLAIEVLSPSTARFDRVKKRRGYQRNVPEYWIVDLDARLVERWRPSDERPEVLTERLTWMPDGARTPFELDLITLFATIWD